VDEHSCDCPAKVNLSLAILGYDPDARMHAVDTVMAKISLADTISLRITQGHGISVEFSFELASGAQASVNPEENSLTRAYYELGKLAGGELPGMLLRVTKRIPAGSGLGGGSSDAAGFLRLVRDLARDDSEENERLRTVTSLTDIDWITLAAQIGADVPAFMIDGTVRAQGFGEEVESVTLSGLEAYRCALRFPDIKLSTAEMYGKVSEYSSANHTESFLAQWRKNGPQGAFSFARNDFTPIARDACPDVAAALDRMGAEGYLMVAVSGSGSAVFGILPRGKHTQEKASLYEFLT